MRARGSPNWPRPSRVSRPSPRASARASGNLLPVVRRHVSHPGFGGSFSLKRVLPALAPALSYEDMEVSDGSMAGAIWDRLIRQRPEPVEAARLEAALRAYCRQDTLGLLRLVRELSR
jgi:hypothetical protein